MKKECDTYADACVPRLAVSDAPADGRCTQGAVTHLLGTGHISQVAVVVVVRIAVDVVGFHTFRARPEPAFRDKTVNHMPAHFLYAVRVSSVHLD